MVSRLSLHIQLWSTLELIATLQPVADATLGQLKEAAARENPCRSRSSRRNCSLWWTNAGADCFWRTTPSRGGSTLEKFTRDSVPWEGPHAGAAEQCEEEGGAERNWYELTMTWPLTDHPQSLCTIVEEEAEEWSWVCEDRGSWVF